MLLSALLLCGVKWEVYLMCAVIHSLKYTPYNTIKYFIIENDTDIISLTFFKML